MAREYQILATPTRHTFAADRVAKNWIDEAWHSHLLRVRELAESETMGYLLNATGKRKGIDPYSLLSGDWRRVEWFGNEELLRFFDRHPDLFTTREAFTKQLRREERLQKESYTNMIAWEEARDALTVETMANVIADVANVTPKMVAKLVEALQANMGITDAVCKAVGKPDYWGKRGHALYETLCAAYPGAPLRVVDGVEELQPF